MAHVYKRLDWCMIDVNTDTGQVLLQERWKYNWLVRGSLRAWTEQEKTYFHTRADRAIWDAWSNRVRLDVEGRSLVARSFSRSGMTLNLDIERVTSNEHWNVTVWKIAPGAYQQSEVFWTSRRITLDINDFIERELCHGSGAARTCTRQVPVAHEFGHAAGNTAVLDRGDEYGESSTHRLDRDSILNSGRQLRLRHFRTIIDELNTMIPDCNFAVRSLG
jgi:hypothetical protein